MDYNRTVMFEASDATVRRRLALLAITLATIPCYCIGWIAVALARPVLSNLTPTVTATFTWTSTPPTPTLSLTPPVVTGTASTTPTFTLTPTITTTSTVTLDSICTRDIYTLRDIDVVLDAIDDSFAYAFLDAATLQQRHRSLGLHPTLTTPNDHTITINDRHPSISEVTDLCFRSFGL